MHTDPEPHVPPRAALLREAERLITGDRNHTYGEPTETFANIAAHWTIHLRHKLAPGAEITGVDVGLMMLLLKIARSMTNTKRDSFVDMAGYAACAYERAEVEAACRPENAE